MGSPPPGGDWRRVGLVAALTATVLIGAVGPATAATDRQRPGVVVDLETDGSAALTVVTTYDLTADAERAAFRAIQADTETRAAIRERFRARMGALANATERASGRSVAIADVSVDLATADGGETGVLRLTAEIRRLARVTEGTIALTHPFASGFAADLPVVVTVPDGYAVSSATPDPDARTAERLTWTADTDLADFELVLSASETTATRTPGLGPLAAIGGLAGAGLLAWRRR